LSIQALVRKAEAKKVDTSLARIGMERKIIIFFSRRDIKKVSLFQVLRIDPDQ